MKIPPTPDNEKQRIDALYRLNILNTSQEPRYDRLTRLAKQLFDVPIALVSLIDKNRQWFKSRQGLDICETPRDISFCAHAINHSEILEVNDATQDPRFSENPLVIGDAHIRFYAGAPLITHEGFALGTLCIVDTQPRKLTQSERDALRDLADAVQAEIELVDVKKAYAEYQATKERLRRGQIYANIGTWEWSIESGDLFWTEQIGPLFGYPKRDLETTYENFVGALHPDDRQNVLDAVTACIEQGKPYDIEHRVVWPDGTIRWLLERGDVERDAQGKPLKMLGVVQDIHDRKQAEMALAEREQQLLEAQRLANIGNWHANLQTGELFWSEQVFKIFGHDSERFVPSVQAFHAAVHPDDIELVHKSEKRAEQSGRHDIVHRIVRPDGEVRYVHELAEMQLDSSGQRISMMGTVQDVTEVQLAKQEAERANRAKSEFLSSMSHELRTPLNSIIGFSQLLELSELSEKQKKHLQTISTSGKHLLSLINDVLEFAKLESGKLQLNIESVEVKPVVERAVDLVKASAMEKDVNIHLSCWSSPVFITADPVRFKQVLVNLLSNGIKYNRTGGKLHVSGQVIEREHVSFWRLAIEDTGLGIAQQDLHRLFTPFDRLGYESSNIQGTGIGLSITKDLVEQMGGWIEVSSEVNVGTTFSVGFLLDNQQQPRPTVPLSAEEIDANPSEVNTNQTLKVLYVEDNPANMKLMVEVAQLMDNIELRIAPSAENGLQQAQAWLPQLILLDINLPGMNGDEAIEYFRALPSYQAQQPTIFALTANVLEEQVAHYHDVGFDQVIAKPFDLKEIMLQIEAVRDRKPHVS